MTTWQTGGLDGEVADLDREQSSKVADLDGVVTTRLETIWQICVYGVVSGEVVDRRARRRASRRCDGPGRQRCGEVGDEVADLCVEVAARLGTRWQAGRVADLHGIEEADPDDCDLDGKVAVLDSDLRQHRGRSGKRATWLGVRTGRRARRRCGMEDGLGFGRNLGNEASFREVQAG